MTTTPAPIPTSETALPGNGLAYTLLRLATRRVDDAARVGGYPVSADVWDAYEAAAADVEATARIAAATLPVGATVYTPDGPLVVARRDAGASTLSADGRPVVGDWHRGAETGDSVRYEYRDDAGRRTCHGYVDPTTRRIVQTG